MLDVLGVCRVYLLVLDVLLVVLLFMKSGTHLVGPRDWTRSCSSIRSIISLSFFIIKGFYHEQSRPDRDDYVEIIWDNIKEGNLHARTNVASVNSAHKIVGSFTI